MKVPPGENLIVLLRQSSPFGYNLSFSYSSTIVFTTEALKRQVKERGNKIARRDPRLNVVSCLNLTNIFLGALNLRIYSKTWCRHLLFLLKPDKKSKALRDC